MQTGTYPHLGIAMLNSLTENAVLEQLIAAARDADTKGLSGDPLQVFYFWCDNYFGKCHLLGLDNTSYITTMVHFPHQILAVKAAKLLAGLGEGPYPVDDIRTAVFNLIWAKDRDDRPGE